MIMSTQEQETFETALSARDGFVSIKEGLSRVDVRQVWTPPWLIPRALAVITLATIEGPKPPLSDWQAECRNTDDKDGILLELEEGVGSIECNRLVVSLMRKALVTQAKAAQAATAAWQLDNLAGLLDEM